jgi:hypothetical protein
MYVAANFSILQNAFAIVLNCF